MRRLACIDVELRAMTRGGDESEDEALPPRDTLQRELERHSPHVEPHPHEPGAFWLDASGLGGLYPSLHTWARRLQQQLARELVLSTSLVVGFTRFGTYALARAQPRGLRVLDSADEERALVDEVPLARLSLATQPQRDLARLGIVTLGQLLRLPASALGDRFGAELRQLHELARGERFDPFRPQPLAEPVHEVLHLEPPEDNRERLVFLIKSRLHDLLARLSARHEALVELVLVLHLDDKSERREALRPARPTLELERLIELVHLRLAARALGGTVKTLTLHTRGEPATTEQLALFVANPKRDLDAAARAFARLRAELGAFAVVRARLTEGHLPEAQFRWEPLDALPALGPPTSATRRSEHSQRTAEAGTSPWPASRPLVRWIYPKPIPLPPRPRDERNDGWLVRGVEGGPVVQREGPFVLSGAWWQREVQRDYHYLLLAHGELLWAYYDRQRRRWFCQGGVD